jgi:hypothetical protein
MSVSPEVIATALADFLFGNIQGEQAREEIREIILHLLDVLEREWFPGRERTSDIRRRYKADKRTGQH